MRQGSRLLSTGVLACAAFALGQANVASAQYTSDFEAPLYSGSAAGVAATGQDGWFLPNASSTHGLIMTYAGNTFGLASNPEGDSQMIVVQRTNLFARAQRDIPWVNDGCWRLEADFLGRYTRPDWSGTDPLTWPINNLASISLQPALANGFYPNAGGIILARWDDPNDPNMVSADDYKYTLWWVGRTENNCPCDVNGVPTAPGTSNFVRFPTNNFRGLSLNNWYHLSVTMDMDAHRVMDVAIRNITTGGAAFSTPVPNLPLTDPNYDPNQSWYMEGGAAGTATDIAGLRFFGGGGTDATTSGGNTMAYDNLCVVPCASSCASAPPCPADLNGDDTIGLTDLAILLAHFGLGPVPPQAPTDGDLDGDQDVDLTDLAILLAQFGSPCPT